MNYLHNELHHADFTTGLWCQHPILSVDAVGKTLGDENIPDELYETFLEMFMRHSRKGMRSFQ